jgi:hypothetical protein
MTGIFDSASAPEKLQLKNRALIRMELKSDLKRLKCHRT